MSVSDIVPDPSAPGAATTPANSDPVAEIGAHPTATALDGYLYRTLTLDTMNTLRRHLDGCETCWDRWNRHRWDVAARHPLYTELAHFLGPRFRPYYDSSRALATEWDAADPRTDAEIAEFFRTSTSYLYNLVIWEASGNRPPYLQSALKILKRQSITTIVDVGCGIGSDAIALAHSGFRVTGCDYDSPSRQFMTHRTGGAITTIEPDQLQLLRTPPDALWIIDTLDHLTSIEQSLGAAITSTRLVITEDLSGSRSHGTQRFHHRRPLATVAKLFNECGLHALGSDGICHFWARY
ncbi:class I SAM-dependent methyltransferase [Nocardia goodfellowii]